jgi:hypothetical protein
MFRMKAFRFRIHTLIHKVWVFWYLLSFALKLIWRGIIHDWSKFSAVEAQGFGELLPQLHASTYGDASYQALMQQLQPILQHHYRVNRHHPEHFPDGYRAMTLEDIVEMWCDWRASVKKHEHSNLSDSLAHCQQRFGISEDLIQILRNTANLSIDTTADLTQRE